MIVVATVPDGLVIEEGPRGIGLPEVGRPTEYVRPSTTPVLDNVSKASVDELTKKTDGSIRTVARPDVH